MQLQSTPTSANASLSVAYSNVKWSFLKDVYGWAAVQYQAWARGELTVHGNATQSLILHTDAILEFWIDDEHFFGGDFFTFRRAPPVLHLTPGSHRIDLRLARDVRAFGGILEPTIDVVIEAKQASSTLELSKPGILMSDVVDGKLPSSIGAVFVRNSGQADIEILGVRSANVSSSSPFASQDVMNQALLSGPEFTGADETKATTLNNTSSAGIIVAAGQTRSVIFNVTLPTYNASSINYTITYKHEDEEKQMTLNVSQTLKTGSIYRPHKITYLHPGGIASYAMLRPPAKDATCRTGQTRLPVLLALHGAGLEAEDPMVPAALDAVPDLCAWVLFPTGVTPWSSDDWHNWGFADVEAAIAAISSWIEKSQWSGSGVDTNRWIVSGHSNGGQGTWYALTHRPDKVLAAAPVSGYASIQKYVPYELWQPADPRRTAIVSASLNSYRHEMLMENTHGVPIQQQHGEIDDNVPAYNSRLLAQQISLTGSNSSYNEVPGQNHYWDGVMVTPPLVDFYYTQTNNKDVLPRRLQDFTMVVGNPGDMGSKGGIKVLHLVDPGKYGRVEVNGHRIWAQNVQSLEFDPAIWMGTVIINNVSLELDGSTGSPATQYVDGTWTTHMEDVDASSNKRSGRQLGSMTAILRTHGQFLVQYSGGSPARQVALQVTRNLHQYFQADSIISSNIDFGNGSNNTGNVITLVVNSTVPNSADAPIQVGEKKCSLRDRTGQIHEYGERATGVAYIHPLQKEALELVVWGADADGLRQAARVVPMLTGVGQPDFVIFGENAKWRGIEGVLAMGFFDSQWEVTASSVV